MRQAIFCGLSLTLALMVGPLAAQEANPDKKAREIFDAIYGEICPADMMSKEDSTPQIYHTTFNYGDEDYDPRPYTLYRFHCFYGAYNESAVYFGADDYGEVKQIQFAVPEFEVKYENADFDGAVESIEVIGFTAQDMIINSDVDPDDLSIYSWSKWRGIGDASSVGVWIFRDARFVLQTYDVDASYDGEVNPTRIYGEGGPDYGE